MRKVMISYADKNMAYSLKRIGTEAKRLEIFDEVKLFSENDLPEYIKSSPLMKYKRGGGYWAWKPALIWETLQLVSDDSIVVYVDAGCTLNKSDEWSVFFDYMKEYDTLCFAYKDEMLDWEQFGQTSSLIKYWTKKNTIDFFRTYINDSDYDSKYNKIMGGALFVKGKSNSFIKSWLDVTLKYPELVVDPTEEEIKNEYKSFFHHTHDQSIITPLAHYFTTTLVLSESAEVSMNSAIVASRIRTKTYFDFLKLVLKNKARELLGLNRYNYFKSFIK